MAATFQSISAIAGADASGSVVLNAPSGVTSGDLLVLCAVKAGSGAFTTPSNWTQIQSASDGFSAQRTAMYYRIATGGADDTPTLSLASGTADILAQIVRISGQAASSPLDTSAVQTQTSGSTAAIPSISTAEADELLIACIGIDVNFTGDPSTWDQRGVTDAGDVTDVNVGLGIWTKAAPTSGSYGTETASIGSSNQATRIVAAFKSAAGGGGSGNPWYYRAQQQAVCL